MRLPGEVFELRDACVRVFVRIINHGDRLVLRDVQRFMFKIEAAIGQLAETIIRASPQQLSAEYVAGRLPATIGWQPVLRRKGPYYLYPKFGASRFSTVATASQRRAA